MDGVAFPRHCRKEKASFGVARLCNQGQQCSAIMVVPGTQGSITEEAGKTQGELRHRRSPSHLDVVCRPRGAALGGNFDVGFGLLSSTNVGPPRGRVGSSAAGLGLLPDVPSIVTPSASYLPRGLHLEFPALHHLFLSRCNK